MNGLEFSDVPAGQLPVVLISNGAFNAAGIAYNEAEYRAFTDPSDMRPKVIFLVPVEKLVKVSDGSFLAWAQKNNLVPAER